MVLMGQWRSKERHDAVAHDLVDGPLGDAPPAIMCSRTESRSCRASSGSRSASSSIEPFRSANSTVTRLRSPSRAGRDARIFSARYAGGVTGGAGAGADAVPPVQTSTAPSSSTARRWP